MVLQTPGQREQRRQAFTEHLRWLRSQWGEQPSARPQRRFEFVCACGASGVVRAFVTEAGKITCPKCAAKGMRLRLLKADR